MVNDLSWFDISNYTEMEGLSSSELNYELLVRRSLIEEVSARLELDALYPKQRRDENHLPLRLQSIIEGLPSFSKSVSFVPQITIDDVSELSDAKQMEFLADYHYTKRFSPKRDRRAVGLRTTRDIIEDYKRLRDFQGDFLYEYGFSKENWEGIDYFLEYSNYSELPARDRSNNLPTGNDIVLSLNIEDYTNEELIESFKTLLDEVRTFYKCPGPKRVHLHRKDDIKKLFEYRAFALIDAEIWRSVVNPSMTKTKVIEHVLSGTKKGYDYKNYDKTIRGFIAKVLAPNYFLP